MLLEIASGRQALAGTVRAVDGPAVRFSGWLELAAAIERVRLRADEARAAQSDGRQPA
jgi:hypothetical protein